MGRITPNVYIIYAFNHNNSSMLLLTENIRCLHNGVLSKKKNQKNKGESKFPFRQIIKFKSMRIIPRYPLTQDK